MSTRPEDLAATQHEALKLHILETIEKVRDLIIADDYKEVMDNHMLFSPAGDGYGSDNYFINFDYSCHKDGMDLYEVLGMLQDLQKQSNKKTTF
jgi:hypothetical protein